MYLKAQHMLSTSVLGVLVALTHLLHATLMDVSELLLSKRRIRETLSFTECVA